MADRRPHRETLLQHLAQAGWHVAQGEEHIYKQEALIAELDRDGHDATDARALLQIMRDTQALHREDVKRILTALKG
jgi:hypothetical protein